MNTHRFMEYFSIGHPLKKDMRHQMDTGIQANSKCYFNLFSAHRIFVFGIKDVNTVL